MSAPRLAVVSPFGARLLLARLEKAGWSSAQWRERAASLRLSGQPGLAEQLESDVAQLRAAAEDFDARREPRPASARGSAEAEVVVVGAPCAPSDEVLVKEAKVMLGVSDRMVRLWADAGVLDGRKVGRSWVLRRESVLDLVQARESA